MKIIAHMESDFPSKFGIPRQSGRAEKLVSRIVFEPEYRVPEALRGIEEFSHLWLIWVFSEGFSSQKKEPDSAKDPAFSASEDTTLKTSANWSPTVRPPRLGGNERLGVWATRSPNRPNPIGLSCVEIVSVEEDTPEGPVITVRGADLLDGTPILDIKPYIAYADARPDARCSYAQAAPNTQRLTVTGIENLPADMEKEAVIAVLSGDPRPSYQDDPERIYGMRFGAYDIRFRIEGDVLTILETR